MSIVGSTRSSGSVDPATRIRIEHDPPGAMSKWLIPGPFPEGEHVWFNSQVAGFTRYLYANNPHVRNAVNMFRRHVLKSGFSINATVGGKTYKFNKENKDTRKYFTDILMPGVERVVTDWILCGYSIVRLFPIDKDGQFPDFVVMRDHVTEQSIEWVNDRRVYHLTFVIFFWSSVFFILRIIYKYI